MDRIRELAAVLAQLDDIDLIEGFIRSILTDREIRDLSLRWELVKRLRRGDTQRTIARDLGVSLCKITRGSRELKAEPSPLGQVVALTEERSLDPEPDEL